MITGGMMPIGQGRKAKTLSMTPHDIAEYRRLRKLSDADNDSSFLRSLLRNLRDVKEPFLVEDVQLKPRRKPRSQ